MSKLPQAHGLREALAWADQLGGIEDVSRLLGDPPGFNEQIVIDQQAHRVINELNSRNFMRDHNAQAKVAARSALIYAIRRRQLEWWHSSQTTPEEMELLAEAIDACLHLANAGVFQERIIPCKPLRLMTSEISVPAMTR